MTAASRPSGVPTWLMLTPAGGVCLVLSLWGCVAIYTATVHMPMPTWFAGRQLAWIGIGTVALLLASGHDEGFYRAALPWAVVATHAALWLVLVYGIRINGMRGWFAWNGLFMQPSELAKPVFVLSLVAVMERTRAWRGEWLRGYAPALGVLLLWTVPVALQPDFGGVLIYAVTFALTYWCLGGRLAHLALSGLGALPVAVLYVSRHPYLIRRLLGFLHQDALAQSDGWHLLQFQRSLAAGGWFGRAWGQDLWSRTYLPLGYNDSIFASTAEAVGFIGLLPLILLVVAWVCYACFRAVSAGSVFSRGAIIGLAVMLAAQAFIHFSVNLGLMPTTGITLPLISYGGSSLLATMLAVGMVEGLSRSRPAVGGPLPAG